MKKERHTKEQLIEMLWDLKRELGRNPSKNDVSDAIRGELRREFGKWCYALEASGIRVPSKATLDRRKRHRDKWKALHKKMSYKRSAAGKAELEKTKSGDQQS